MYREVASPADPAVPELVCEGTDPRRESSAVAMMQLFGIPLVVAAAAALIEPWVGLAALVGSAALVVYRRRAERESTGAVLRVEHGDLIVASLGARRERARFRLASLRDVALETKTIQIVHEGATLVPGLQLVESKVGPKLDKARIVFVRAGERDIHLTDPFLAHMDATEWLGKIRVFLRKQGWLPESELRGDDDE